MAEPKFADVKQVLDRIIEQWTTGSGMEPDLAGIHGASFSWSSRAQLLGASARGNLLIQPDLIGAKGRGRSANIVIDLTSGLTVGTRRFPRMPLGGLDSNSNEYLDPQGPEIQTIVNWIEAGCPD